MCFAKSWEVSVIPKWLLGRVPTLVQAWFVTLFLCVHAASAAELAGVQVEEKIRVGARDLVLNGAGIRVRAIFNVYVGALYLAEKKTVAADVLSDRGPKRIALTLLRDLTSQQLVDAFNDGMRNNTSADELEALKFRVEELAKLFTDGKRGDEIHIDYLPESGTTIRVNGEQRGRSIAGEDLSRAVLRTWLGERPADGDLKKSMLGQGD